MPKESQPGRATGVLPRPAVLGENPANHVFVDLDLKRQGDLLSDSRTAPVGIPLFHFDDDRTDELCARPFRAGLPTEIRGEQHAVLLLAQGFVKAKQCRRLQNDCGNGADELDAPRAPSSQRGPGPTRVNSEIVSGSDSRSGSGA